MKKNEPIKMQQEPINCPRLLPPTCQTADTPPQVPREEAGSAISSCCRAAAGLRGTARI